MVWMKLQLGRIFCPYMILKLARDLVRLLVKFGVLALMGSSASAANVELCITALADALNRHQFPADGTKAVAAAKAALDG